MPIGALTQHMMTGLPPGQTTEATGVPAAVERVVRRALHRDPGRRWPTAAAYAAALEGLLAAPTGPVRPPLRRTRRALTTVGAVAATLVMAGSSAASATPPGWTRVRDGTGTVSVAVPDDWARQLRDGGWKPALVGLPGGHNPGLLVGPDLAVWADVDSPTPGVFVGVSPSLTGTSVPPTLPDHPGCTRAADRTITVGSLRGSARHWARCADTAASFSEVTLIAAEATFGGCSRLASPTDPPDPGRSGARMRTA
ncbi:hypothetical protein ABZU25_21610 [Micromonospora sp. NPDC005215]|uniref:hypothetical protein n=1 Tax=Micromonospora sp. NPDC005215 TaxID=3157024 RepID=UPI0033BAAF86